VCRSDGTIFFSDPQGHLSPKDQELGFSGVYRIAPDGSVMNATSDTEYPNGLTFSPVSTNQRDFVGPASKLNRYSVSVLHSPECLMPADLPPTS